MLWAGHMARMGEKIKAHGVLVKKSEEERLLGRPKRRWKDNIKINRKEL
jgi:hypothetical protein